MSARVSQRDGDETKVLGRPEPDRVADARSDLGAARGSFLHGGASASRSLQLSQHLVPLPPVPYPAAVMLACTAFSVASDG